MTALELFTALGPIVADEVEREFERQDLCILTTRAVLDVCRYFGIAAREQAVRVRISNAIDAAHREAGYGFAHAYPEGAWSVGVGYGLPETPWTGERWDGHLIAIAGESWFGDFALRQAERPQHGIVIGAAVIAEWSPARAWQVSSGDGTTIRYECTSDRTYLGAPDWREGKRRRPIVARLIRRVTRPFAG